LYFQGVGVLTDAEDISWDDTLLHVGESKVEKLLSNPPISRFCVFGSLEVLEIPNSVVIAETDFYECNSLKDLVFPGNANLREIHASFGCSVLERIKLPSFVELISATSFRNRSGLKKVLIGANRTLESLHGFDGCTSLQRIVVPANVTVVGNTRRHQCTSLATNALRLPMSCLHRRVSKGRLIASRAV
jgi:hypothetical protein